MRLFLIEKNKIVPNPAALTIREFKQLWIRDTSKNKDTAILELSYVYFISDYKSVYLSAPPEEREQVIMDDLGFDKYWKPDKEVQEAVQKYNELQQVPTMRLLNAAQSALEQLVQYFKAVDFKERDKRGQPVYRALDVTKAMGETARVADSLDKLRDKVKKELDTKGKIRGGGEASLYED
jgi:hypothetical protein